MMLCCLLAAMLLGPVGFLATPRANAGQDCCAGDRRGVLARSALFLALIALCSVLFLLGWFQPFRHICSLRP
jgi:hypothetical protein